MSVSTSPTQVTATPDTDTVPAPRPGRTGPLLGAGAIGLAVGMALTVAVVSWPSSPSAPTRGPVSSVASAPASCPRSPVSADTAERRSALHLGQLPMTPDAAERWAEACA